MKYINLFRYTKYLSLSLSRPSSTGLPNKLPPTFPNFSQLDPLT